MDAMEKVAVDCLVIGGGPAGLTAAVYLARFRRKVMVVDSGSSRALLISHSFNYPGAIGGISGPELIRNLQTQAEKYGAVIRKGEVSTLMHSENIFKARMQDCEIAAKKVLMATGLVDHKPSLPAMREFIYNGVVRFCPICDGYEAIGKRIGILGPVALAIPKALFLRTYTSRIFIFPTENDATYSDEQCKSLAEAGIHASKSAVRDIEIGEASITCMLSNGDKQEIDILYPAMGASVRSDLALELGARANSQNYLFTDSYQETSVEGLYAAGDITMDLSQISVAVGQAAIATTAIHKNLPPNIIGAQA